MPQTSTTAPSSQSRPLDPLSIDAFLFDLGGVLIDWSPRFLFAKHFPGDESGMHHFLTRVCPPDWNLSMDAGKPVQVALAERIAEYPQHETMIRRWIDEWPAMMKGPVTGVPEMVAELKRRDARLYALTNWSAETFHHAAARFQFLELFEDIVVSGRLGLAKPDPAIFRHTIAQCRLDPARTLFIDDSVKNTDAAAHLGFQVHQFTSAEALRQHLSPLLSDNA